MSFEPDRAERIGLRADASPRRRSIWRIVRGVAIGLGAMMLASVLWVEVYRFIGPPSTLNMTLRAFQGAEVRRDWVPIDEISPHLIRAVIAAEDSRFCSHAGFDIDALQDAVAQWRRGDGLRGASTISQQTAKNAFLWNGGSFPRKAAEAWFTVWMELLWPKRRVMEVYLNLAEWGDGLFGAEAAARARFGVSAANLSRAQAAQLAAVLPSPNRWRLDPPGEYVRNRAVTIQQRMWTVEDDGLDDCVIRD